MCDKIESKYSCGCPLPYGCGHIGPCQNAESFFDKNYSIRVPYSYDSIPGQYSIENKSDGVCMYDCGSTMGHTGPGVYTTKEELPNKL